MLKRLYGENGFLKIMRKGDNNFIAWLNMIADYWRKLNPSLNNDCT